MNRGLWSIWDQEKRAKHKTRIIIIQMFILQIYFEILNPIHNSKQQKSPLFIKMWGIHSFDWPESGRIQLTDFGATFLASNFMPVNFLLFLFAFCKK